MDASWQPVPVHTYRSFLQPPRLPRSCFNKGARLIASPNLFPLEQDLQILKHMNKASFVPAPGGIRIQNNKESSACAVNRIPECTEAAGLRLIRDLTRAPACICRQALVRRVDTDDVQAISRSRAEEIFYEFDLQFSNYASFEDIQPGSL